MAAPFLSSVMNRSAKAQAAAAPRRLIVMFTHYGCVTTRFFPKKSHGRLTADDLQPTTLKHLIPYLDKLLMPRGIRSMNEWTTDMSRGQGNDPHLQAAASFLTCQPVSPNSDEPFSFDQTTKFNAKAVGPSLDHVIARQLSPDGKPLLMHLAGGADSSYSAISYSDSQVIYSGLSKPSDIFSLLTGLFTSGAPVSPDSYQAVRGKSIIDLVREDLERLQRYDMSRADREKLEAWKALLYDTGGVVTRQQQCEGGLAARLGVTAETTASASTGSALTDKMGATDFDRADLYSNFAALAAICNANPVIVLKYPPNVLFKDLGLTTEADSLAHRVGTASMRGQCVKDVLDQLAIIDDYYTRKFAYLAKVLDSIEDGEQTLLDSSAAVWFQDVSDGCALNHNNLPIVQLGSAGGYFKTGWAVNVEDGSPNLTTGNSEIVCAPGTSNEVDAVTQNTGTDPRVANAPINKYFCNLMNALGVMGGPDGFPAKGGNAEVTCFGMYDRTEDFPGGGTTPPKIHSPGEFSVLKA